MIFLTLLATFAMFTLMDAVNTALGLTVGLIELNPIVTVLGLETWIIFRILLLVAMLTTFLTGYRICLKHSRKGTRILEMTLLILNAYIGSVVFVGFITILRTTF